MIKHRPLHEFWVNTSEYFPLIDCYISLYPAAFPANVMFVTWKYNP